MSTRPLAASTGRPTVRTAMTRTRTTHDEDDENRPAQHRASAPSRSRDSRVPAYDDGDNGRQ